MGTKHRSIHAAPSDLEAASGSADSSPRYFSFVLRCQAIPAGAHRVRLSDVRTGLGCSLGDLDELPDLIRRLIADGTD